MDSANMMMHAGIPVWLGQMSLFALLCGFFWYIRPVLQRPDAVISVQSLSTAHVNHLSAMFRNPALLGIVRVVVAVAFLILVYAGLFGTQIPQKNAATVVTWTLWWTLVVMSVFFVGSLWCAVCPWDTIASWLAKRKLWRRQTEPYSLDMKTAARFRNVIVAAILFTGLSWLELGYGITLSPYATSVLALVMVVLATASMLMFERKAFCQYFCPVGRTIGAYSQLSVTAIRPVDAEVCKNCKTLECYHGTDKVDPCPTHLVVGKLETNTYCISCGNCIASCPHQNVAWASKRPDAEPGFARVSSSEAMFLVLLLALALFHGVTMLPTWDSVIKSMTSWISGFGLATSSYLLSFSMFMLVFILLPFVLYALLVYLGWRQAGKTVALSRWMKELSFSALPIAFTYHIAHNLSHLARESRGLIQVLANPLGMNAQPLSRAEIHSRHMEPMINADLLFVVQILLVGAGFLLASRIARTRLQKLCVGYQKIPPTVLAPLIGFVFLMTTFGIWLLMQPMTMRF